MQLVFAQALLLLFLTGAALVGTGSTARCIASACRLLVTMPLLMGVIPDVSFAQSPTPISIGVLAVRPAAQEQKRWQPLSEYLQQSLGDDVNVTLRLLDFDEIDAAIRDGKIDVVITNAAHYRVHASNNELTAPLASLIKEALGIPVRNGGGAIIVPTTSDIMSIEDLRGRRIAAPATSSLNGYQAQAYELSRAGVQLPQDAELTITGLPHDLAIMAVLQGRADAAFVEGGVLEDMLSEGKITGGKLRVLNQPSSPTLPFLISTTAYPEMPVAARRGFSEQVAKRVAAALYEMSSNSPAAREIGIHGFALPYDYEPVRAITRALRLPPYDKEPPVTFSTIWRDHRTAMLAIIVCALVIVVLLLLVATYASRLLLARAETARQAARANIERSRLQALLRTIPDMVWLKDEQGKFLFTNPSHAHVFGLKPEQLTGHSDFDFFPEQQARQYLERDRIAVEAGKPVTNEEWLYSIDGTRLGLYLTTKTPVHDAQGNMIGVLGIARDITEMRRAQVTLNARYRAQRCIYETFHLTESLDQPLDAMLERVANTLPSGWEDEGLAATCIRLDQHGYGTPGYRNDAEGQQSAAIVIKGETRGSIHIARINGDYQPTDDPLGDEKQQLIDTVAERISSVVERRIDAEAAARREEIFHAIVSQSTDSILLIDLGSLRFIEFNEAACNNLGYSHEEFANLTLPDLLPESELTRLRAAIARIEQGKAFHMDVMSQSKDGTPRYIHLSGHPIHLNDGVYLSTIATDISARRQAEERLRESEERFRRLFEDTRQAALLLDEDGRVLNCNKAVLNMIGLDSVESMLGRTPDFFSPEKQPDGTPSAEKAKAMLRAALEHGAHQFEWEHLRANGTPFCVEVMLTALEQHGKWIIFDVWRDITQEKRTQRELEQYQHHLERLVNERTNQLALAHEQIKVSEQRYADALDASNDGIWDWNIKTQKAYFSPTYFRMLGYEPEEFPTSGFNDVPVLESLLHPDDLAPTIATVRRAIDERQGFGVEYRMRTRDGSYKWIRNCGKVVEWDNAGQPVRAVGTHADLTSVKATENSLREAKEQAEAGSRAKSTFLATMSHEIRTPLNAIIGMSHLALMTEVSPRVHDYLSKIQSSSKHLLSILNDILDYSKIEAGKLVVDRHDFDVESLLGTVSSQVGDRASAKGLELVLDIAPDVPRNLVGDSLRIGQILLNLGGNAVKFTERGEVAFIVLVKERNDNDAVVLFAVRDTGIGLSTDQKDRLFQSFQQADDSTTRKYGGTGLGLAISKRLAELMGGEIGVTSELGVGSTFWFTVPVTIGEGKSPRPYSSPDLRGRRVLIADDNAHAREVIQGMLERMDLHAHAVSSGSEALVEILRTDTSAPYDLAFLDWQMHEQDGIACAREIQSLGLVSPPRVAIVTAYGHDDLIDEAKQAGAQEVLMKPVTASQLFNTVMRLLGSRENPTYSEPSRVASSAIAAPPLDLSIFAGKRALVVEDNTLNQQVATELLTRVGFTVDVAADGAVAQERVGSAEKLGAPYDIVLMDMQMPVMDGLTATRELRKTYDRNSLPIIAMTANAMVSDRERCLEAGMNDHLPKPIEPVELWSVLARWVRKQVGHVPTPPPSSATSEVQAPPATITHPELPHIDGLDAESGLHRVGDNVALYQSILRDFAAQQAGTPEQIREALKTNDWDTAQLLAHTLKGLAGTIGAKLLQHQAAQIEHTIRRRPQGAERIALEDSLGPFAETMGQLVRNLEAQVPSPARVEDLSVEDKSRAEEVQRALTRLLRQDDIAARDLLESNTALLRTMFAEDYPAIERAVKAYDFELALQKIEDVKDPLSDMPTASP